LKHRVNKPNKLQKEVTEQRVSVAEHDQSSTKCSVCLASKRKAVSTSAIYINYNYNYNEIIGNNHNYHYN